MDLRRVFPHQEVRTAVVEGGRVVRFCDVDEVGAVLVRGPNVFPGYLVAEQNRGVFIDLFRRARRIDGLGDPAD
jgi:long-subunit acyl-CoA synthetase (AMP-forming)